MHLRDRGGVSTGKCSPESRRGYWGVQNALGLARYSALGDCADWIGAQRFLFRRKTFLGKAGMDLAFAFSSGECCL